MTTELDSIDPAPATDSDKGNATQLVVLISGVFHAAYMHVLPDFERETGFVVRSELSPSLGDSPQSVANRLARGEEADVLIMAGRGLDEITARNMVLAGTRVELARAPAGLAMKKGAVKPDISTPDQLRKTPAASSSPTSCSTNSVSRSRLKARRTKCRA
jgi:molybdate transport system substrate-binding protein